MISIALDGLYMVAARISMVAIPWIAVYWPAQLVKAYEKRS
ncbi:hypothetical protein J2T17_006658 [Paenibacillus mucilaginosus]